MVGDAETPLTPPGDSREQRDVEAVMVALLTDELGVPLTPRTVAVADGRRVEIDAVSPDMGVLCEAWAHQGPPKSAQRNKVLADALKLVFAWDELGNDARLILLLSEPLYGDRDAAAILRRLLRRVRPTLVRRVS